MRLNALWWWIDRWRKSTAYTDMTLEEQGAYRNLLDEAQLRGGPLPNDERILGKACGDALAWKRVRAAVMARFVLSADGWRNETLDHVIRESHRRAEKQRNYRNKSGNAGQDASGNAPRNGDDYEDGNSAGSPDPDPSQEYEDQNKPAPKPRRASRPVKNRNADEEPSPDRDASALRDSPLSPRSGSEDRRLRVEGADEAPPVEAGLRLPEPGAAVVSPRSCGAGDAEGERGPAGEPAAAAGANPASAARPAVERAEASGSGAGRADAGRRVSNWSRIGAA